MVFWHWCSYTTRFNQSPAVHNDGAISCPQLYFSDLLYDVNHSLQAGATPISRPAVNVELTYLLTSTGL